MADVVDRRSYLPRYNEHSRCTTCGNRWVTTECRDSEWYGGSVLMRRCIRCGSGWAERPLYVKDPPRLADRTPGESPHEEEGSR